MVLESKYGSPRIVNDGVTVAKEVELEDPVENIGAKLVRQVRSRLTPASGRLFAAWVSWQWLHSNPPGAHEPLESCTVSCGLPITCGATGAAGTPYLKLLLLCRTCMRSSVMGTA